MTMIRPFLAAITGGSGSGKSWLSERLQERLGDDATIVSLDDFYRDRSRLTLEKRERINFDHPNAIDWRLFTRWIVSARRGCHSMLPCYDFETHTRAARGLSWKPTKVVLVNGLWLLWKDSIRQAFDFSIFVDCPEELRLERRAARDVTERGRTPTGVRRQFSEVVAPMHNLYVAPQAHWANMVLVHPIGEADVDRVINRLRRFLPETQMMQEYRGQAEENVWGACSI